MKNLLIENKLAIIDKNIKLDKSSKITMSSSMARTNSLGNTIGLDETKKLKNVLENELDYNVTRFVINSVYDIATFDYIDGMYDKEADKKLFYYIINSKYENVIISDIKFISKFFEMEGYVPSGNGGVEITYSNKFGKIGELGNKNIYISNSSKKNDDFIFINNDSIYFNYDSEFSVKGNTHFVSSKMSSMVTEANILTFFTKESKEYTAWSREEKINKILK